MKMEIVTFDCPTCGYGMEAPVSMDGETHPCLNCKRPVTLQVITQKQAVTAGLVAGGLAALLGIIFGGSDY
jgi:hypothetical protein